MEREFYGRHPDENCSPSVGGGDCGVDWDFYKVKFIQKIIFYRVSWQDTNGENLLYHNYHQKGING